MPFDVYSQAGADAKFLTEVDGGDLDAAPLPITLRRGTTAERNASNPILAAGEPAVVLDSGQPAELVLGDGVTAMADLPIVGDLTPARPPVNTLGVLGDSITDFGTASGTTFDSRNAKGYWVWALIRLRHRLRLITEAGVAGNTTAQMLDRLDSYLANGTPGWNLVLGGTNDAAGLVDLATITANLTAIYDRIADSGGRVVAVTVPPKTGASSAQNLRIAEVNRWIKQQGGTRPGLVACDVYPALVAATSGDYAAGMSADGTHPAPQGASVMGKIVADTLTPLIPALDVLPYGAVDTANLITNPLLTGTGGTVGTGGTGSVATGWQVHPDQGVASVFACSKVARTDGIAGEWQQVVVTSGQVKANFNVSGFGTTYNTGDRVYAVCEFETDADLAAATGNWFRLKLVATKPDFGDGFAGYDLDNNVDTAWPAATFVPRAGVFVTPVITVPSTATLRLAFELQRKGAGTIRVSRAGIYREGTGP